MTVSFEGINKGDRIRLTAAKGDEATVTTKYVYGKFVDSDHNTFHESHWDTLEILSRALPTEPGWYESSQFPLSKIGYFPYYLSPEGEWKAMPTSGKSFPVSEKAMRDLGPLRRLVPEN